MSTVLITGASGFIGARLHRTVQHGCSHTVVPHRGRADGDLADFDVVRELVKEIAPDIVFHLAAEPDRGADLDDADPRQEPTHRIARNFAEMLPGSARVISIGSAKQYGRRRTPARESDPQSPTSLYGRVKSLAEAELSRLAGTVSVRLGPVYGPGQPATGFIPVMLQRCQTSREAFEVDPYLWSPLYIDDAVDALVALGTAPGIEGGVFNLSSSETRSLANIAQLCAVESGWEPEDARAWITSSHGIGDGYLMDPSLLLDRLDWRPQVSLVDGIGRCARHMRLEENGE